MIIFKGSFHSSTKDLYFVNVLAALAFLDYEAPDGLMTGDGPQDRARSCLPSGCQSVQLCTIPHFPAR